MCKDTYIYAYGFLWSTTTMQLFGITDQIHVQRGKSVVFSFEYDIKICRLVFQIPFIFSLLAPIFGGNVGYFVKVGNLFVG